MRGEGEGGSKGVAYPARVRCIVTPLLCRLPLARQASTRTPQSSRLWPAATADQWALRLTLQVRREGEAPRHTHALKLLPGSTSCSPSCVLLNRSPARAPRCGHAVQLRARDG